MKNIKLNLIFMAFAFLTIPFISNAQIMEITVVSVASDGTFGDDWSGEMSAVFSADGRYIAFDSRATNLVPGDTNGQGDVFLHDTQTGITTRVSIDSVGTQAIGGASREPSISADGRYITFNSTATNLVAGDTNASQDVSTIHRLE